MANSDLPVFVGRQEEMNFCWQIVSQGQPGDILLVQGPDGIGKSALLDAIRSRCQASQYHYAHIDFSTRREYASYPNFLSAATDLWCQLKLGTIQELGELVTNLSSVSGNGTESRPSIAVTGQMGEVGPGGQAAIGMNIIQVQGQFYQTIRQDDARVIEPLIRATVTGEVQQRLQALARHRRVVLLLDAWEAVLTEQEHLKDPGAWICDDLLPMMANGAIPDAVAVIACTGEPGLGSLTRGVHRLRLQPLPIEAVQAYMAPRVGLASNHQTLIQLASLAQGNPLAMKLLADGAMRRPQNLIPIPEPGLDEDNFAVLGYALDRYLETFSAAALTAIRGAAVPHRLDSPLLAELGISEKERGEIAQCSFISWDAERTAPTYHPVARRHLLDWWDRNDVTGYGRINRKALEYFIKIADAPERVNKSAYSFEREIAYHKLIDNETEGAFYLLEKFSLAWDLRAVGQTQGYIDPVIELEQRKRLTQTGQKWLRYFLARLRLLQRRGDWGESEFASLAEQNENPLLQALARWSLGNVFIGRNRWTAGVRLYRDALNVLQARKAFPDAARVLLSLGQAYSDLAQASGDFPTAWRKTQSRRDRVVDIVQHLPFLMYEAIVRRTYHLPNWYFGTNYQDWIVAYLLSEGAKQYRQAEERYQKSGDTSELPEIQLSLAEIDHRLHRQARAKQRYEKILASPDVQSTQGSYRKMRALLGRGHLLLEEKQYIAAEVDLQEAREGFEKYGDSGGAAAANELLGQLYTALLQVERAVEAHLRSLKEYLAVGDSLSATRIASYLEEMEEAHHLPQGNIVATKELLARQFILRFPDRLLRWFRRIALIGALPLTYLVTLLMGFAIIQVEYFAEGEFLLWMRGLSAGTQAGDIIKLLAVAILPLFFVLWFYRFVYTVMGFFFVQYLGRRLSPIEEEQPRTITCTESGITWDMPGQAGAQTIPWQEVNALASLHFHIHKRPVELISSSILVTSSGHTLALETITSGYQQMMGHIQRHLQTLQQDIAVHNFDFTLFERRSLLATASVATLIGLAYLIFGFADAGYYVVPSGDPTLYIRPEGAPPQPVSEQTVHPVIAPFLFAALPTWILLHAAVSLWRLVRQQYRLRRLYRPKQLSIPLWIIVLTATLLSLATLGWVLGRIPLAQEAMGPVTRILLTNGFF